MKRYREVFRLAIPNILSNISVPLIASVDTGLMGHLSSAHLAAVGSSAMIFNFLYWNFGFLRMGTTGFVAQAYGRKDQQGMTKSFHASSNCCHGNQPFPVDSSKPFIPIILSTSKPRRRASESCILLLQHAHMGCACDAFALHHDGLVFWQSKCHNSPHPDCLYQHQQYFPKHTICETNGYGYSRSCFR